MLRRSHGLDSSLGRDNYAVVEGTIRYSKVGQVSQNLKKELLIRPTLIWPIYYQQIAKSEKPNRYLRKSFIHSKVAPKLIILFKKNNFKSKNRGTNTGEGGRA